MIESQSNIRFKLQWGRKKTLKLEIKLQWGERKH